MITDQLLRTHPIISDQVDERELRVLLRELERLLRAGCQGSVVEFGCYVGTTSLFIRRLLDAYQYVGAFHVYDSFAGLPEKTAQDASAAGEQFVAGELAATRKGFFQQFKKAGLRPPVVHKAWFAELTPQDVPEDIMFAFLDGDYYQSIMDSLWLVTPKLTLDAVLVVDDYANEALPGAARAADAWLQAHPGFRCRVEASLAVMTAKK
jgi:putative O-methyltransferase